MDENWIGAIVFALIATIVVSIAITIHMSNKETEVTKRECIKSNRPASECAALFR